MANACVIRYGEHNQSGKEIGENEIYSTAIADLSNFASVEEYHCYISISPPCPIAKKQRCA